MFKKRLQLLFFLFAGLIIGLFFYFELNLYFNIKYIEEVKVYFLDLGLWAPLIMIFLYILFNIAAIPRVFFTIFSGYIFGVFYGFLFAWVATIIGLTASFLIVRYLFRDIFERKFGNKKLVGRINQQIDKHGLWLIVFLRAIYVVPSSVLNYSFGFKKIKTLDYLTGSAIGFIPVVLFNVWTGNTLINNLQDGFNYEFIIIGIVLFALVYLGKRWYAARTFLF